MVLMVEKNHRSGAGVDTRTEVKASWSNRLGQWLFIPVI